MDTQENHCTEGCYNSFKSNCIRLDSGDCTRPHYGLTTKSRTNISEPALMVYESASLVVEDADQNDQMVATRRSPFITECPNSQQIVPSNLYTPSQHSLSLKRSALNKMQAIDRINSSSSTSLVSSGNLYRRNSQIFTLPSSCMGNVTPPPRKLLYYENFSDNPRFIVYVLLVLIVGWSAISTITIEYLTYSKTRVLKFFDNVGASNKKMKSLIQNRKKPSKQLILWSPLIIILGLIFCGITIITNVHDILSRPVPLTITRKFNFYKLFK